MKTLVKKDQIPPVHPGEILREEFLEPEEISQSRLAQATGLPASRITDLVKGRRGVTPDSAIRLGKALGTSPDFWLNLQKHYDLRVAQEAHEPEYAAIELLSGVVAASAPVLMSAPQRRTPPRRRRVLVRTVP